jgi:uncharacterized protein (TIGR03435 family)
MMMNPEKGELTGIGANMRMLTEMPSNIFKRPVADETGVDSTLDMKLQWKPDSFVADRECRRRASHRPQSSCIFTAITEQLGLRLVSKKGPVTVYVVENAERPSEN